MYYARGHELAVLASFLVNKKVYLLLLDSQSSVFVKLYLQSVGPRIILGFRDRDRSGRICSDIRIFSRVWDGLMLCVWCVGFPRCVVMNM